MEHEKRLQKHTLAVSLKELDLTTMSSTYGGSNSSVQSERKVYIPKNVGKEYTKEEDIQRWFPGYEAALHMNGIPEKDWGARL